MIRRSEMTKPGVTKFGRTALLLFVAILGCNASQTPAPHSQPSSEQHRTLPAATGPQNFDYYLLNLSWSPEFCHSHRDNLQCSQQLGFILHGLWPQNLDGSYPQHCNSEPGPRDLSAFRDIGPDPGLLDHEWKTHGTCSGLAPDAFFNLSRHALRSVAIPPKLDTLDRQISLTPDAILDLFRQSNPSFPRDSFALSCGNNYLTAIEVCMNKSLQPISCGAIRSCRANSVRIAPRTARAD
jgi:ribonuclease T2